jgi:hypothetical protein
MECGVSKMRQPGRKRVANPLYRKSRLSSDAIIILALLKKQPQDKDELLKNIKISRAVFYRTIGLLEDFKILRKTEDGYALCGYSDSEKDVINAIGLWEEVAFRYPTPAEIANETGLSLENAEALARKTHGTTGWFVPNQAMIENAGERLGEVLVCAARIRDLGLAQMNEDFDYDNEPEIVTAANVFLQKRPDLVPRLANDDVRETVWSPEALKYLGGKHQPKERGRPFVAFRFG